MTNHPGRPKPGSAQPLRMTPQQLRDIIDRAGLTQQQAADLAGVALPTMKQYLSGLRPVPESAAGLLCLSLIVLGGPAGLLAHWLRPEVARAAGELRFAAATAPAPKRRSRAGGDPGEPAGPSGG